MTTPAAPESSKPKNNLYLYILLALGAVILAAFLASRVGLDKALVKSRLDEYAALLQEKGREHHRDISFTYDDLEIAGGITNRHAVVHNPVLSVKPLEEEGVAAESIVISAPDMLIYPAARSLSALRFLLPGPINFTTPQEPEKSLLRINTNTPLEVTIAQQNHNKVPYTNISHKAPGTIELTYLREKQAQGVEDATPEVVPVYETIEISIAPGSHVDTSFADDGSGFGKVDVSYGKTTLMPKTAPEGLITIAGAELHWGFGLNDKKAPAMSNKVHLGPVSAAPEVLPYAPVELTLDAAYAGVASPQEEAGTLTLRKFELSTKESTLAANADFTISTTDILPAGSAQIKLSNVPFMRAQMQKYQLLTEKNEAWVADLVEKVTGTAFDQLQDADIPIERIHGGAFKIGKSTFEEVFATVLKQALKPAAAASPSTEKPHPTLPAADKPKAAPVVVPDMQTRG